MNRKLSASLIVFVLACSFAARADQDDIDNNADLQPTPEEKARLAVLRRWPDATDIDAVDMADDDDDAKPADPKAKKKDDDEDEDDGGDKMKDPAGDAADAGDMGDMDNMGKRAADVAVDDDDIDDAANWSVSVLFVSAGKHFEALVDDDGKIQYVYETVSIANAPKEIVASARDAVKDGEIVYFQKVTDESQLPTVQLFLVGVGNKDVLLSAEGKVLHIKDAPDDDANDAAPPPPAEKDDDDGDNFKMRI